MKKKLLKMCVSMSVILSMMFSLTACGGTSASGEVSQESSSSEAKDTSGSSTGDTIYIGTAFPMSGNIASEGQKIVNGIQLAVDQVNAEGGINGRMVALKSEDDESDSTTAASVANKFGDDESVYGTIMSYNSPCALAGVPILEEAGLVNVSPAAESDNLTGISDWFFRTCSYNSYCGIVCAQLIQNLNISKVAILYQNDDYGQGLKDAFISECNNLGIEIVTEQSYVMSETVDFSTQLTAISNTDAEGIFISGVCAEAGMICAQRNSYNCGDLVMVGGTSTCADEILEYEGVEGFYAVSGFSLQNTDSKVQDYISQYKEKYNVDPSSWSAYAYDAAMVMMEAMKKCGDNLTRETLKDAIAQVEYVGVTGKTKFEKCNTEKDNIWMQVKDGKWQIYE